jgi:hypothetical protein
MAHVDSNRFLRQALTVDGVASGLSGLPLLVAPRAVADLAGAPSAGLVAAIGLGLVAFGALVLRNARREAPRRGEAVATIVLNVAWVVASLAVIEWAGLTTAGNWLVALVADAVLLFAVLETIALRRAAAMVPVAS